MKDHSKVLSSPIYANKLPSLLKPGLLLGLLTRQAPIVELELEETTLSG